MWLYSTADLSAELLTVRMLHIGFALRAQAGKMGACEAAEGLPSA